MTAATHVARRGCDVMRLRAADWLAASSSTVNSESQISWVMTIWHGVPHMLVYVVVEVVCGRGTVRMSALHDTVLAAVKRMHGDYGKYNEEKLKELEEQLPAEKREKLQQEKRKALGAT
ncbi:hypothetical protein E2C01_020575 [Portunus trituberculatus]|uniref:Uncharacterized protein n=1 Tax=Portunus trituberculatus TaxID=210409 RepID=A0A5B7E3S4_PORTR|nr:hypothetical protein [Portunus trituberculatus]